MNQKTKSILRLFAVLLAGGLLGSLAMFGVLFEKPGKNLVWKIGRIVEGRMGAARSIDSSGPAAWGGTEGLKVEVHASGFDYPVRIVFAPSPPQTEQDPFYYVAQLGGSIQVVTKGGQVHPFASGLLNFKREPLDELGLIGLTYDDIGHQFFATMSYWDAEGGVFHNKVERLGCSSDGLQMTERAIILDMNQEPTVASYQIQFCALSPDGLLYVGVGSGGRKSDAQNLSKFAGKILRLHRDGTAVEDNPFYDASDPASARSYVYAYGFRNPYDIAWDPRSHIAVVSDVGPSLDRIVRLEKGINYNFGTDEDQMRTNALYTWGPGGGYAPVGVSFGRNEALGPEYAYDLYVGLFGIVHTPGPNQGKRLCRFKFAPSGHLQSQALDLLLYEGNRFGTILDVEWGPDGLYFLDLYGQSLEPHFGGGVVYRVTRGQAPSAASHAGEPLVGAERGRYLFYDLRCNACHTLDGQGGSEGPDLTQVRSKLAARLSSQDYQELLRGLARDEGAYFVRHRPVYEKLLSSSGRERLELWIRNHLLDPRFDNPKAKMPSLELADEDIAALTKFLLDRGPL